MLTVKQPFTMEGASYSVGDRIIDPALATEALTNFPTSVLKTACAPCAETAENEVKSSDAPTPTEAVKAPARAAK